MATDKLNPWTTKHQRVVLKTPWFKIRRQEMATSNGSEAPQALTKLAVIDKGPDWSEARMHVYAFCISATLLAFQALGWPLMPAGRP